MPQAITVKPIDGKGWQVLVGGVQNPQHFSTGGEAERSARRLAARLAEAGQSSEITVYLRDGTLGGRFVSRF